jgi:hypothetical protein
MYLLFAHAMNNSILKQTMIARRPVFKRPPGGSQFKSPLEGCWRLPVGGREGPFSSSSD